MRCGRAVRRAIGCASRASDRRKSGHWLVANAMFNKRVGATTGGKTWLEAGRAGQRCNWMVGYNPPGRSHTSHTLGVALRFEQKHRRNVPCSERRHVPEARFRVLPPRPPSPTPTNYMSVPQTDNIRTTRACQTRRKKNVKTRRIPLPACRSWGRTRNHDTRCVSKQDDTPPRVTTLVVKKHVSSIRTHDVNKHDT